MGTFRMSGFNGIEAIDYILSEISDAHIIVFTTHNTGDVQVLWVPLKLALGVTVLKGHVHWELLEQTIRAVHAGQKHPGLISQPFREYAGDDELTTRAGSMSCA